MGGNRTLTNADACLEGFAESARLADLFVRILQCGLYVCNGSDAAAGKFGWKADLMGIRQAASPAEEIPGISKSMAA